MIVGFLKEKAGRTAPVVPSNINKLLDLFEDVLIEKGIGAESYFSDDSYEEAKLKTRAEILSSADVVIKISPDFTEKELG